MKKRKAKKKPARRALSKLERKELMLDAALKKARLAEQRAVELSEENERLGYVARLAQRILALDISEVASLFNAIAQAPYGHHVLTIMRMAANSYVPKAWISPEERERRTARALEIKKDGEEE